MSACCEPVGRAQAGTVCGLSPSETIYKSQRLRSLALAATGVAGILMLCFGCRRGGQGSDEATNPNIMAWRVAHKAEDAPTYRDARYLLSQIDIATVTDQDVRELVAYQQRFCTFCIDTGVPKDVKMDTQAVLTSINPKRVARTLIEKGITKASQEARRLADEATALIVGLDKYLVYSGDTILVMVICVALLAGPLSAA